MAFTGAPVNNPRGFVEYRNLGGQSTPRAMWFRVKAAGKSGPFPKFPGDPVVLVSGDTVARIPAANTVASLPIVGVIRNVYTAQKRPLTFNQPSVGGPFLPSSTAGWVEVCVDPQQTYLVNADSTVTSALVGQFVDTTAAAANTAAGRSGISIKVATATVTASGNSFPFQVIGVGAENLDGVFNNGENNQDVEVVIANHAFRNTNKVR